MLKMPVLTALFVLALSGLSQAQDDGNHGVVLVYGHQFFRANSNFELSVKSSAASLLHVTANIEDSLVHSTLSRNSSYLRPDEMKRLWLPVGEVAHNGKYQLVVSITHNSITENATSDLLLMTVHRNVLIQTDKPQYRPGDIINYRVLVLDDKLRLARDVPSLGLYLQNPTGDFQEHTDPTWQNDEFRGFFNGSFGPLPLEPEPGEWSVLVATSDRVKLAVKSIMVSDYERPRFAVDVSSAPYVMRSDNNLHVNISLRDYFGQPISGIVDINLSTSKTAARQYLPQSVNGTGHFQLPIVLEKVTCETSATAADWLTVKVTAQASPITRSLSAKLTVPVFCDPLKLIASTSYQTFQPGTQFNVTIKAVTHDGQPYVLTSNKPTPCSGRMEIDMESSLNGQELDPEEDENEENQLKIDNAIMLDSNTLVVPVTTPSNAGSIELKCRVAQAIRVFTFKEHSGNFAAIRTDVGRTYRVGDVVEFSLECTQGCTAMDVVVVTESGILSTITYAMVNEESGPLSLRVTADMVPLTRIVAYHTTLGYVGSDMAEFHVKSSSALGNITLTVTPENASRTHVLPGRGEKVQVDVRATKNALVGLLAVEKGLRQLDPDFDSIAKQIVNQKLPTDDLYETVNGGADLSPFSSAGLVAQLFTLDSGGLNPAKKQEKSTPVQILRQDLRDSFLFRTAITNEYGVLQLLEPIPDDIAVWTFSAFAVSSDEPLAVTTVPAEISVLQDFHIEMNLPVTLIENEVVFMSATVFTMGSVPVTSQVWKLVLEIGYPFPEKTFAFDYQYDGKSARSYQFRFGPYNAGIQTVTASLLSGNEVVDRIRKNVTVIESGVSVISTTEAYLLDSSTPVSVALPLVSDSESVTEDSQSCNVQMFSDSWGSLVQQVVAPDNVKDYDRIVKYRTCNRKSCEQTVAWLLSVGLLRQHLLRIQSSGSQAGLQPLLEQLSHNITDLRKKALRRFLNTKDGSYNLLGSRSVPGSTWLTAAAIRAQLLTSDIVPVNAAALLHSVTFLDSRFDADRNEFVERGSVSDIAQQGGAGSGVSLTAFVLLAYAQAAQLTPAALHAQAALERRLPTLNNTFEVAITCFALRKVGSVAYGQCPEMLMTLSQYAPGVRYWRAPKVKHGKLSYDIDVETTAYALLALTNFSIVTDVGPIVNWLTARRSPNDIFQATQNDIISLYAISEVALDLVHESKPCQMQVTFESGQTQTVRINPDQIAPQFLNVPLPASTVALSTAGPGRCRAIVACRYNRDRNVGAITATTDTPLGSERKRHSVRRETNWNVNVTRKLVTCDKDAKQVTLELCLTSDQNPENDVVDAKVTALSCYVFDDEDSGLENVVIDQWDIRNTSCTKFLMWKQTCKPEVAAARPIQLRRSAARSTDPEIDISYSLSDASDADVSTK